MKLMLKIVLPLSLASLLVVVICVKYGAIRNLNRGRVHIEVIKFNNLYFLSISEVQENKQLIFMLTFHFILQPQTPLTTLCNWVEIPRTDVTLKEKLGEGVYGEVYKGLVRVGGQVRACAVKRIKGKIG